MTSNPFLLDLKPIFVKPTLISSSYITYRNRLLLTFFPGLVTSMFVARSNEKLRLLQSYRHDTRYLQAVLPTNITQILNQHAHLNQEQFHKLFLNYFLLLLFRNEPGAFTGYSVKSKVLLELPESPRQYFLSTLIVNGLNGVCTRFHFKLEVCEATRFGDAFVRFFSLTLSHSLCLPLPLPHHLSLFEQVKSFFRPFVPLQLNSRALSLEIISQMQRSRIIILFKFKCHIGNAAMHYDLS